MVANQSKHTVQFSDLAWEEGSPELPRAWQVGCYLDRYFQTYCQGVRLCLETKVDLAEHLPEFGWRVQTTSSAGGTTEQTFDYLLVGSGFFGSPVTPKEICDNAAVPVVHSSKYRGLVSLLGGTERSGGKILVVGGQMSGIEVAGTIATHISAATHSPDSPLMPNLEKYTVHHIVSKPAWVFPLHTTPKVPIPVPSSPSSSLTCFSPRHLLRHFYHLI